MAKSFERLLLEANDHDLCSGVYDRILGHYGDDVDASEIAEHERVVLLVLHSHGIIGNGGFRYLFEGHFQGDPYFSKTAAAYRTIGCKNAADAFRKALAIFPDSMPPRNIDARLRYYLRRVKGTPTEIDRQFFTASDDVTRCLAKYIRAHADDYRDLEVAKPFQEEWRERTPAPQMRREAPKRVATIDDLPHWARVAFAARCARRVLPLWSRHWPESADEHPEAVRTAIDLAEQSAAEGRPVDGLDRAHMHAVMAAGAALLGDFKGINARPPENAHSGTIASFVAKAAEHAAKSATTEAKDSTLAAMEAWSFATQAAGSADEPEIMEELKDDFTRLFRVAKRGGWTNRTKVPIEIWSML